MPTQDYAALYVLRWYITEGESWAFQLLLLSVKMLFISLNPNLKKKKPKAVSDN